MIYGKESDAMKLEGLYTVLITPFDQNNALDEEGLRENIRFQLANNVDGIVALGTTAEAPTLTDLEKDAIIHLVVEEVKGKLPVVVGTGTNSTAQTIEDTLVAERLGADGALIITPYYNKPTQEGIYLHFKKVAETTKLPIILYNNPPRVIQNIQIETLKRLMDIPSIIGIKEAAGSVMQMMEIVNLARNHRPDFRILSGDDALTVPCIAMGGHGIMSVVSNLIPSQMKTLTATALNGEISLACAMHYQLFPFFQGAFIETNPIPIKTAMNLWGMPAGGCRLPLCAMGRENKKKLEDILAQIAAPAFAD
jgi:4-hydroxy-tetrahydrodipicolinate synthase